MACDHGNDDPHYGVRWSKARDEKTNQRLIIMECYAHNQDEGNREFTIPYTADEARNLALALFESAKEIDAQNGSFMQ